MRRRRGDYGAPPAVALPAIYVGEKVGSALRSVYADVRGAFGDDVPTVGAGAYLYAKRLNAAHDFDGMRPEQAAEQVHLAEQRVRLSAIVGNLPARVFTGARTVADAKLKAATLLAVGARYMNAQTLLNAAKNLLRVELADTRQRDPVAVASVLARAADHVKLAAAMRPADPQVRYLLDVFGQGARVENVQAAQQRQMDPVVEAQRFAQNVEEDARQGAKKVGGTLCDVADLLPGALAVSLGCRAGNKGAARVPKWVWWAGALGGAALLIGVVAVTRPAEDGQ
jgi:hypothetical protein